MISLLSTKFYIPPPRAEMVLRSRLMDKLLSGLDHPRSFTLLSGPAGSGKTTLLSHFAGQLQRPTAWLSLDTADDDFERFWTYLLAACQTAIKGVGEAAMARLNGSRPLPSETIPTLLINDLVEQRSRLVLVLDDYHVITSHAIHESMAFLLEHLPDNLHVVISTRTDPPWALARYRVRNQLTEVRAADLRFSSEETAKFLNHTMGLELSGKEVAALEARTEGWVAGLQLAAIALQSSTSGSTGRTEFVEAFAGSHTYVADYLVEEVLKSQPERVQAFLLRTSILERLTADLCNEVTQREDAHAILAGLHRTNVFVVPLDHEGKWFRYHHLFADLLQVRLGQTLSAEAIAALHTRAADWYERNSLDREAIHHALAANNHDRSAALVDRAGQDMVLAGRHDTLQKWLEALPPETIHDHPRLEIYQVLIALSQGRLDMKEETLRDKEKLIRSLPPSPDNDRLRLEAMVYLSLFLAHQNTSRTIELAQETLAELLDDELKLRTYLYSTLYRAYGMEGKLEEATRAYQECARLGRAAGKYGVLANTTMVRAFDLCQYGRLDEALSYCQLILDIGARLKQKVFYPAGPALIGLAGVYLERNVLDAAEAYLTQGLELCRRGGMDGLYTGYIQRARLSQARGDLEGALKELQRLEQALQRWDFTLVARQVSVRLAMTDVAGASRLITPLLEILGESPYAHRLPLIATEAFRLSLARIYLAQGALDATNRQLDEVEATVELGGRFGRQLEVELLRALVEQKKHAGQVTHEAAGHFRRALELGEPAGFVVLFLEEGLTLVPLLNAVLADVDVSDGLKRYARKIVDAFAGHGSGEGPNLLGEVADLVEQLTPREIEVLQLIAAGDSNQAIADRLFITIRTVKKHAGNIYGKLGVSSRTQAVARARELGLLSSD